MIIASLVGGVTGSVAFVLTTLCWGIDPPGLVTLNVLGGSVSLCIIMMITLQMQGSLLN